ncbi:MAG: hypothetical protein ACOH2D_08855 [Gelidibacter sp.]|uniref:hypothetical protein n=1 Tax=Gelidibacter sp. TaxID=2018083 RepID=UPI003265B2DE
MKKALIIAPEYMGYIVKVADELRKYSDIEVTDIHIPSYKYDSLSTKIKNFFYKQFSKDLKFDYREDYIKPIIKDDHFDIILIIRPDMLSIKTLAELKARTKLFKTYFFDGVDRFPRKKKTIHLFDEIYSFEPNDCKTFGFKFITNFIYELEPPTIDEIPLKYSVFNITSYDRKRFPILLEIAKTLKEQQNKFKIIVKTSKDLSSNDLIEITEKPIPLEAVKRYIKQSACMLDLGVIKKHKGLTFRVFEAMGYQKKIITNNSEIATYDFYNPQNILIIDEQNIAIPNSFLNSSYAPIPDDILKKYTLESWVKTVFKEVV